MNKIFVISVFIFILVLYKAITIVFLLRLKTKLKDRDFNSFIELLGDKCQYRLMFYGYKRYKWSKRLIIVKANFNDDGVQISKKIKPLRLLKFKSELSFINEDRKSQTA